MSTRTVEFLERLREAIARRGMTQAELARRLAIREATVSDWFNRESLPNGATMLRLPEVLGVDGHWLLTGSMTAQGHLDGARPGLSDPERVQVAALLDAALRVVTQEGAPAPPARAPGYTRIREATADERRALAAVEDYQRGARGRRTRDTG